MNPDTSRLLNQAEREKAAHEPAKGNGEEEQEWVNHPQHYNQGNIEVIDFIEDQKLDFNEGCVVKYLCRYKVKGNDPVEELEKIKFYVDRLIAIERRRQSG